VAIIQFVVHDACSVQVQPFLIVETLENLHKRIQLVQVNLAQTNIGHAGKHMQNVCTTRRVRNNLTVTVDVLDFVI
jgi:hypothetical protein